MTFYGNPNSKITAIDTSGGIVCSRTSGQTPCFIHVSASAITCTGVIVNTDGTTNSAHSVVPYEDLEFSWNFGDPSGVEIFPDPATGASVNANSAQIGPEAVYCYRSAGTYTVTLTIRGKSGSGFTVATVTQSITVTLFNPSGGEWWFDSNFAGTPAGTLAAPFTDFTLISGKIAVPNTAIHIKRVSNKVGNVGFSMSGAGSPCRVDAYGVGADPIFENTAGTYPFSMTNGGGASPQPRDDIVLSNLTLKRTGAVAGFIINVAGASNATATITNVSFDNCDVILDGSVSTVDQNQVTIQCVGASGGIGFWGGSVVNQSAFDGATGIFFGFLQFCSVVGTTISGQGTSSLLDHHIYPDIRYHSLYRWINFGSGPKRNFCINNNWDQESASLEYAEYHCISDCKFSGTLRAFDGSNGTDDPTKSLFRNYVVQRCAFDGLSADACIILDCTASLTFRDSNIWGCDGGRFWAAGGLTSSTYRIYRNKGYRVSANGAMFDLSRKTWTAPQQFTDNIVEDVNTVARLVQLESFSNEVSIGTIIDRDQYYIPNDIDSKGWYDSTTPKTFAQWQAFGFDVNGSVANPNWPDPANGIFVSTPVNQPLMGNTTTGALSPDNTGGGFHSLCDPLFGVLGDELGHLHLYVGGQNRKIVTSTRNDLFTVFLGSNGPGGCALNGANVGDIVRGVIQLTSTPGDKASSFESTISVKNQIRQVSTSDLSAQTFIVEVRRQS